jgi:hypothetical protein
LIAKNADSGMKERSRAVNAQPASGNSPASPATAIRHENRCSSEIGRDHRPSPIETVCDNAAMEAEDEGRHAVGEANGGQAQGPARL